MLYIAVRAQRELPSGGRVQRGRSPLWRGLGYRTTCPDGVSHAAEESRDGAALFGGGSGTRPPARTGFPSGRRVQRGRSPLWRGFGYQTACADGVSHPAGESREGAALFGGGLGVTPQPPSAPLPAREAERTSGGGTRAGAKIWLRWVAKQRTRRTWQPKPGEGLPAQRESPERA